MTKLPHAVFKKVTEVLKLKKTNFGDFLVENGIKVLLKAFKIGFSIANIVVLVSSFQQNAQHLKSIHFWTNYKHFCDR